jgi:hypothetical protein
VDSPFCELVIDPEMIGALSRVDGLRDSRPHGYKLEFGFERLFNPRRVLLPVDIRVVLEPLTAMAIVGYRCGGLSGYPYPTHRMFPGHVRFPSAWTRPECFLNKGLRIRLRPVVDLFPRAA